VDKKIRALSTAGLVRENDSAYEDDNDDKVDNGDNIFHEV
jgi:hypothetical protein